ncbi:hypothetical protein DESC_830063 [Desulfosarcina cetonica]|nr:hypothetical protein DESC_830063 [Desulfosarcina cetonica]
MGKPNNPDTKGGGYGPTVGKQTQAPFSCKGSDPFHQWKELPDLQYQRIRRWFFDRCPG